MDPRDDDRRQAGTTASAATCSAGRDRARPRLRAADARPGRRQVAASRAAALAALALVAAAPAAPAAAATYDFDLARAAQKYGGWLRVPPASLAWISRIHGVAAADVLEGLRRVSPETRALRDRAPDLPPAWAGTGPLPPALYVYYLEAMAAAAPRGSLPPAWKAWLVRRHPHAAGPRAARDDFAAARGWPSSFDPARLAARLADGEPMFPDKYSVPVSAWGPGAAALVARSLPADLGCGSLRVIATRARRRGLADAARDRRVVKGCF